MNVYLFDGKNMTCRRTAYRIIRKTLQFPNWFGNNLDALADCLSELDPNDTVIIFINTNVMVKNMGPYAIQLLTCFRDLSDEVGFIWFEKA